MNIYYTKYYLEKRSIPCVLVYTVLTVYTGSLKQRTPKNQDFCISEKTPCPKSQDFHQNSLHMRVQILSEPVYKSYNLYQTSLYKMELTTRNPLLYSYLVV